MPAAVPHFPTPAPFEKHLGFDHSMRRGRFRRLAPILVGSRESGPARSKIEPSSDYRLPVSSVLSTGTSRKVANIHELCP